MCWLAGSEKLERVGYEGGLPSFRLHAWGVFFTSHHTEPRRRLLGGKISSGWDMLPWRCLWDTHMKKCGCLQVPLPPAHPAFSPANLHPALASTITPEPPANGKFQCSLWIPKARGSQVPLCSSGLPPIDGPSQTLPISNLPLQKDGLFLSFPLPSVGCYLPLSDVS